MDLHPVTNNCCISDTIVCVIIYIFVLMSKISKTLVLWPLLNLHAALVLCN